jgi:heavy metal translocating P-type ATPase
MFWTAGELSLFSNRFRLESNMRSHSGFCDLCGLPIFNETHSYVSKKTTYRFCCTGCKQVFRMLWEASDSGDPEQFKQTELFQKCKDMGIIPVSVENLLAKEAAAPPIPSETGSEADGVVFPEEALPLNLKVSGMWCLACAWVLEEMLKKQPGIMDVSCNFSTDRLRCVYDPIISSPDQIISVINRLGYQATIPGQDIEAQANRKAFIRFAFSAFLTANVMMLSFALYAGFFTRLSPDSIHKISWPIFILTSIVLVYGGSPIYRKAWIGLTAGIFGMETLITLGAFSAYLYSTFNFFYQSIHLYYDTAAMLITLTLLGKTIEQKAKASLQEDLGNFLSLKPTKVKLCNETFPNGRYVSAEVLQPKDVFLAEENEIIPADGKIIEGSGTVDESSLTGEARPVQKTVGKCIRSGSRVLKGTFKISADNVGAESTLGQMIQIMEKALGQKTLLEGKTDRMLRWFVPLVVTLAVATGLIALANGLLLEKAMIRSVTVMVIACPCALGIAIPLARVAGISMAGKQGILVRDFSAFERAEKINAVVFDKTGTLTRGDWELLNIHIVPPFNRKEVLMLAASLEKNVDHFIATKIVQYAAEQNVAALPLTNVRQYQNGISAMHETDEIKIGSKDFIGHETVRSSISKETKNSDEVLKSDVYMSYGGQLCARFIFGDIIRKGALATVENLQRMGYNVALVSGDGKQTTRAVASLLKIAHVGGDMLPQDKAFFVREWQQHNKQVAMVGDGINDAPALIQSDLAVALHSDNHLGKEVADITLMQGNPGQLLDHLNLSRLVNKKIHQNFMFSLIYNTISIPVAMSGMLTPLVAVCAMLLSSLSVTGNTLLLIRKYK